uniref:Follicle stimulating hormone receptor n=1 Tax=Sinocyclocheilus rhinocerous TaxID=307959 RepID=A0A673MB19_9TELE
ITILLLRVVSENDALERIEDYAFYNLTELKEMYVAALHVEITTNYILVKTLLTISNTGLKFLPDFSKINSAALEFLFSVTSFIYSKISISHKTSNLSLNPLLSLSHSFLMGNQQLSHIHPYAFIGAEGPIVLDISHTSVHTLPESMLRTLKLLTATYVSSLRKLPSLELFTELKQANLTYASHYCTFKNFKKHKSVTHCIKKKNHCKDEIEVTCYPRPDAFNPCEDIMGFTFLRVLIWFISILAMVGNCAVLLVLLTSRYKLTVPRFLMCHLAFADFCMGIYLLITAAKDIQTQSPGCHAAGFFTVFSNELSVYTLTAIALERWHTITYAMQLRLRHPCTIMAAGWLFALLTALMPILGVSSYSKTSICLPMDVETVISQAAFLIVCVCYMSIYLTVHNATFVPANADMRIAKRMAVLIFTDFLCMAPISFFAISASLKLPLITVSHVKFLLVLFYPINSCSNPFLYAFFTQTFKRDFFILTSRFGCFKSRAHIYRTEISSGQNGAMVPSLKTSDGTLYSLVHVAQVH